MNGLTKLLVRSAAFLWKHPVLWLPALAARTADFLIGFACTAAKIPAMLAVAPHSVLGGVVAKMTLPVMVVAVFFTWFSVICEVGLFVYAMAVCARWSHALRTSEESDTKRSWAVQAKPVVRVAALTLAVNAVTVGVGTYFTLRGGVPVTWAPMIIGCFILMASWFVLPAWLKLVAQEQGSRWRESPKTAPFLTFVIGFLLAAGIVFLGGTMQRVLLAHIGTQRVAVAFAVNLVFACLSSYPLAFSFIAMSRSVEDRPGWQAEA